MSKVAKHFDICQYVSMTTSPETAADMCCAPLLADVISDDDAADIASIFKALSDPIRVRLISFVNAAPNGEVCACDLPAVFDRSQPTMSHHLSILTKAGLLEREQRGKWAWFRVRPTQLAAMAGVLRSST